MFFLFLSCVVVLSLVFASVAPVALMSFSCLRVGLAQAQGAGLILLPSRKNTCRQIPSVQRIIHAVGRSASILSNQ